MSRHYDVGGSLYNAPAVICLSADVCIELWQRIEVSTAQLIGARTVGGEKDVPNRQQLGSKIAHLCSRPILELAESVRRW